MVNKSSSGAETTSASSKTTPGERKVVLLVLTAFAVLAGDVDLFRRESCRNDSYFHPIFHRFINGVPPDYVVSSSAVPLSLLLPAGFRGYQYHCCQLY